MEDRRIAPILSCLLAVEIVSASCAPLTAVWRELSKNVSHLLPFCLCLRSFQPLFFVTSLTVFIELNAILQTIEDY